MLNPFRRIRTLAVVAVVVSVPASQAFAATPAAPGTSVVIVPGTPAADSAGVGNYFTGVHAARPMNANESAIAAWETNWYNNIRAQANLSPDTVSTRLVAEGTAWLRAEEETQVPSTTNPPPNRMSTLCATQGLFSTFTESCHQSIAFNDEVTSGGEITYENAEAGWSPQFAGADIIAYMTSGAHRATALGYHNVIGISVSCLPGGLMNTIIEYSGVTDRTPRAPGWAEPANFTLPGISDGPKCNLTNPDTTGWTPPVTTPVTPPTIPGTGGGTGGVRLPTRLLDSRNVSRGKTWTVTIPPAPVGTTGVALNVTTLGPIGPGFVTAWPCNVPKPDASSLNFAAGGETPNAVDLGIGDGRICIESSTTTDLLVDLTAWWDGNARFFTPTRVVDTRSGLGGVGPIAQNGEVRISVGANENVAMNVTSVDSKNAGFLAALPCNQAVSTSSLNVNAGETRAAGLLVQADATGCLKVVTQAGGHVLADLTGRWAGSGALPARLLDTRSAGSALAAGETRHVPVAHTGKLRLHVTSLDPTGAGFLTAWPCNLAKPSVSVVNYVRGGAVSNDVTLNLAGSDLCVYTSTAAGIIVDFSANG